ncbi:MAG: hypothetical protein AAEJ04_06305, partial [Planctomycetota bacterium]
MISSTLLSITMFFSSGPVTPITPDEISDTKSNTLQVYGRIEDRIGNKILITGFEERVSVAPGIKIQKRGRNDRSAVFHLNIIRENNGWLVVRAQTSTPWPEISDQQTVRLAQNPPEIRKLISRFLLR